MLIKTTGLQLVVKPDIAEYDFTLGDFTVDDDYHDLDISALVPVGAKLVEFWGAYKTDAGLIEARFAQHGHTGLYRKILLHTPAANVITPLNFTIPVDSNRKIQYAFSSGPTYSYINFMVIAYWI